MIYGRDNAELSAQPLEAVCCHAGVGWRGGCEDKHAPFVAAVTPAAPRLPPPFPGSPARDTLGMLMELAFRPPRG